MKWRLHAEGLERNLEKLQDQANGVAAVSAALLQELMKVESHLNDKNERSQIYRATIIEGRIKRDLAPLSEQERHLGTAIPVQIG